MYRFNNRVEDAAYLAYRWVSPVLDPIKLLKSIKGYSRYFLDWVRYSQMDGAEPIRFSNTCPCVTDKTAVTRFDRHYFYQDIWAFRRVLSSGVKEHVDVGSRIDFVGFLTAVVSVTFVDIRPLVASLDDFQSVKGSVLAMPFEDNSVMSLSCLHVAEHIGLGRYGDVLDPFGTKKACAELARILAPGGNLFFSLPVGKPRLCFNAHRIHAPQQVLEYLGSLTLVEFSGIDDCGHFQRDIAPADLQSCDYGCGLFGFTKELA